MIDRFSNIKFTVNEYYIMAELLKASYKMEAILDGEDEDLDSIEPAQREQVKSQYHEFITLAKALAARVSSINDFVNFGTSYDTKPEGEREQYDSAMGKRVRNLASVQNGEEFIALEGEETLAAFETIKQTDFYKYALARAMEHRDYLQQIFDTQTSKVEDDINNLLGDSSKSNVEMVVLPPEFFGDPQAINRTGGNNRISAAFPRAYFERDVKGLTATAMLHEIFHTEIPVDRSDFQSEEEYNQYSYINHALVELSANYEIGMRLCGLQSYFDPRMSVHKEDEMTPARGKTYPYFLMYKNRNSNNVLQLVS